MPKTRGDWIQIIAAVVYIAISVVLYFVLEPFVSNPEHTQEQIISVGLWGPLLYILVYALQVFVPFLPGVSMDLVSGALWGVWGTIFLSLGTAFIAGTLVVVAVRKWGLQTLDEKFPALLKGPWRFVQLSERWPWTLAIVCTLVGDVGYFVAGATRVKTLKAVSIITIARLPAVFFYSLMGWTAHHGMATRLQEQFNTLVPLVAGVTVVGLLIGTVIMTRYGSQIIERLEGELDEREDTPPPEQNRP